MGFESLLGGMVRDADELVPGATLLHTVAHKPTPYETQWCPRHVARNS